ncbi:MAG: sigma-54-dependent Fis family transcriptional regulator [Desulfobacteraceae bacterium]|nr:MAG: sigma-54-dependent Fis family transcriptional regulator [Desulfobacteraceae bacterium]
MNRISENQISILVIDDEIKICDVCVRALAKAGWNAQFALNGYDAMKMMEKSPFDVIVTDLKMSSMGGMEVLRRARDKYPDTMVIVITGYATVSSAVEVMKMGASDYLPKPFTPEELRGVVRSALMEREMLLQNRRLREESSQTGPITHQLIGNSQKIKTVVRMIEKVAPTDSTVLIYGESGTGKELIARAIHANSKRNDKVFFAVDCGTLTGNLLESELFGHQRGAFTGAYKDKEGIFRLADKGTVFLDEISNVSPEVQGKLLRFLESREFLPLGSVKNQKVDIRLVLATNRDLKQMVADGSFREDFFYRIFVYPILVPPLRERRSDILPIAYYFLGLFNKAMGKNIKGFDEEATMKLSGYDWPGNVRQLRNLIERAAILCETDQITVKEMVLPQEPESAVGYVPYTNEELKKAKKEIREKAVERVEKEFVLNALVRNNWNITKAAGEVGLQRTNFQSLMKKHGIRRPQARNE